MCGVPVVSTGERVCSLCSVLVVSTGKRVYPLCGVLVVSTRERVCFVCDVPVVSTVERVCSMCSVRSPGETLVESIKHHTSLAYLLTTDVSTAIAVAYHIETHNSRSQSKFINF